MSPSQPTAVRAWRYALLLVLVLALGWGNAPLGADAQTVAPVSPTGAPKPNVTSNATTHAPATKAPAPEPKMNWHAWLTVAVIIVVLVVLLLDIVSCACAMVGSATFLWLTKTVTIDEVFVGMNNSGVLSILLMYIIVHPIAELPLVQSAVRWTLSSSPSCCAQWPLFKVVFFSMLVSSFVENIPQVAMFTPLVKEICRELNLAPSLFLMPMDFAVMVGNIAVIGSSNNLVASGLMEQAKMGKMEFFELAKVGGIPCFVAILYLVIVPPFLLSNSQGGMFRMLKEKGRTFLLQVRVRRESRLIGTVAAELDFHFPGVADGSVELIQLIREGVPINKLTGTERIEAGDVLVLTGSISNIVSNLTTLGLEYYFESAAQLHDHASTAATDRAGSERAASERATVTPQPDDHEDAGEAETAPTSQPQEEVVELSTASFIFAHTDGWQHPRTPQHRTPGAAPLAQPSTPPPVSLEPIGADEAEPTSPNDSFSHHHPKFIEDNILYEVVIGRDCVAVGNVLGDGFFQTKYGLTLLAVRTADGAKDVFGSAMLSHQLTTGDTLLVLGSHNFADEWRGRYHFYMINEFHRRTEEVVREHYFSFPAWFPLGRPYGAPPNERRLVRIPPWWHYWSLVAFVGVVAAAIAEIALYEAALVGVCGLVIVGVMDTKQAIGYVDWNSFVLVAFSFALGKAVSHSGLASVIGWHIAENNIRGYPLLLLISVLTSALANIITNKAAIQVMFPIAFNIYRAQGKDPLPGVMVAAATSVFAFSTPYGYATNVMIIGPGGYRPTDFLKLGIPLNILMALLVPVFAAIFYDEW